MGRDLLSLPDFCLDKLRQLVNGLRSEIAFAPLPHRHASIPLLLLPDDEHIRNFGALGFAYFESEPFIAAVGIGTDAARCERLLHLKRIIREHLGYRQHLRLNGGQPQREGAGIVFCQNPMNRSIEPYIARWITTGRCFWLSSPI